MYKSITSPVALSAFILFAMSCAAFADKIKHPTAVFSGLDKITGRIISFEVATDETVQFGTLQITERVCYTRPATEAPQTTTFIEVEEVDAAGEYKRIFSGWMFASSPGLSAIEHPVYDIWLTDCTGNGELIASPPDSTDAEQVPPPPPPNATPVAADKPRPKAKPRKVEPVDPAFTGEPGETPPPGFAPPGTIPQRRQAQQRYQQQPPPPQQSSPSFFDMLRGRF